MSDIYESITFDLDKITDGYMRRIAAATDELMDEKLASIGYVKVVRCQDCYQSFDYFGQLLCRLPPECMEVTPDGFCAWGECDDDDHD